MSTNSLEDEDAGDGAMEMLDSLKRLRDIAVSMGDMAKAEVFKKLFDDCLENYCELKRRQLERELAGNVQAAIQKRTG